MIDGEGKPFAKRKKAKPPFQISGLAFYIFWEMD